MNPGRAALGISLLLALGTAACSPAPPRPGQPAKPEGPAPSAAPAPKIPVAHFRSSAAIWFQPQPPGMNGPFGHVGSSDFLALFRPNAPWPQVLARTQAVGFTAGWLYSASNQELRSIVAFLNAHKIGIEIEAPALQARSTCGSGVEGYVPFGLPGGLNLKSFTLAYLDRLKALGADVTFMKVSIQAASAVLLLVALRDSREAGSGDLWKRRHPGVSGECVAECGLSTRNPATSTLSGLRGIPASPGSRG